jgi:hypothetical protein
MASVSGQLHFELDALTKLFTELTTLLASLVTMAICAVGTGLPASRGRVLTPDR